MRLTFFIFLSSIAILSLSSRHAAANQKLDKRAQAAVLSDFEKLGGFDFSEVSLIHQSFFGGPESADIVSFFKKRVKRIGWEEKIKGVKAWGIAGGRMLVSSQTFTPDMPLARRLGLYLHEARHAQKEGWGHNRCGKNYSFRAFHLSHRVEILDDKRVPYAVCDASLNSPTAIEYTFLRSIVNSCTNCSEAMKLEARLDSVYQVLLKLSNKSVAEALIQANDPDLEAVLGEIDIIIRNKQKSGLKYGAWKQKCIRENSCLSIPSAP